MNAVFGIGALRSCALALVLTAGLGVAASGGARADSSGLTPPGSTAEAVPNKPAADTGRAAVANASKGWRYKYCNYVWVYPKNGKTIVAIENKDGSTLWYSGDTERPSVYQEMMMRACSKSGAYYGFRVYDGSTGAWDAVAAY